MPNAFPTARDPLLSLFQSAAAAFARRRPVASDGDPAAHPMTEAAARVMATMRDPTRAYAPPGNLPRFGATCAGLGLELFKAAVSGDAARQLAAHDRLRFSQCDPLWAETLVDYASSLTADGRPPPVPYVRYAALDDFVVTAPRADLRVALFSDWGTGTELARRVALQMAGHRPDIAVHLGDIYYAGTPEECDTHFLRPLREALPDTRLFTLCGNHDVYSGGSGYYGLLRQIGQPASYFCLRSPDHAWQLLAGDTGLGDRDPFDTVEPLTRLDPQEELWHADKLRGFAGRTVFLTHHQPFSAFAQIGELARHSPVNPNLMASHARLAAAGRIDAWFWGHEHRLRLYQPYRGVAAGRNIGYGAIPVEAVPGPATPLPGLLDPPAVAADIMLDAVDGAFTHGYALLDFRAGEIEASYWALTRTDAVYRELLSTPPLTGRASA